MFGSYRQWGRDREKGKTFLCCITANVLQKQNNNEFLNSDFSIRGHFHLQWNGNSYLRVFVAEEFNAFCKYICEIWHAICFSEH